MSVTLLCVQFRNVLPSEELLLFARARWTEAQARGQVLPSARDAILSITQTQSNLAPFEVELTIEGSPLRSVSRDTNPIVAVDEAFAQLGAVRSLANRGTATALDEIASLELCATVSDTVLA